MVNKKNNNVIYFRNDDPREEVGYKKKPTTPWVRDIMPKVKHVSLHESPLKEWWKNEQQKKQESLRS